MAPLKNSIQMSCPNCQAGNLPGSPYCSRCGASLEGVSATAPRPGPALPTRTTEDPLRRFTSEGQDPLLVQQAYDRVNDILTSGEAIEYVAVAHRGSLTHAPDCAVATNKRIILYRKKVLGKLEQDDFYWRDVRSAAMKDGRNGVSLTLESIQGWQMAVVALPKSQALILYELAVEHSEKLAETLRTSTGPFTLDYASRDFATQPPAVDLPDSYYAPGSPPVPQLPVKSSVPQLPAIQPSLAYAEPSSMSAPETAQSQPTPQSVLQAILQQAAGASGAPTRPMPLSAAAFTAPVADAQPVTLSEANADLNVRSMPRLDSLEEIAVFSGPLSGSMYGLHESAPLSPYEPRSVGPANGTAASGSNDSRGKSEAPVPTNVDADGTEERSANGTYDASYPDGPMPLPGSHASGPLLEAAYSNAAQQYADDLISGSLETQHLDARRASDISDRITATNLSGIHDERMQAIGRSRRAGGGARQVPSPPQKPRTAARGEADDPVQKMKQLKAMLDAGLIESEDYEAKKADILSRL